MSLKEFKDNFARALYGETVEDAKAKETCIQCKKPAVERCYSEAGKQEFRISGLCEICFDAICKKEEEEDNDSEFEF